MIDMHRLFYPKKVAVIGVSPKEENLAKNIVRNMLRFTGEVYPVGRSGGTVFGREILPSVQELPDGVDLAVILTPAPTVPEIVDQCGQKGIPWIIVESGGFGEYSEEGKKIQEELVRTIRKWNQRLVGPNCIGVINTEENLVTPFLPFYHQVLHKGKVGIISQSGGVIYALLNLLMSSNIGISKVVSIGNKVDLNENDFLEYFLEDPATEIVVMYLESITDGRKLMELAEGSEKPIIIQKVNIFPSSSQIARFHTAALAADDRVVDAAFRQAGIVRAYEIREIINLIKVLSFPPMKGEDLVILSRSGGMAVSAADLSAMHGFRLYPLPEDLLKKVHDSSRAKVIAPTNPLDLGDLFDFDFYTQITEEILRLEGVDGVIFLQAAGPGLETHESIRLGRTFKELSERYQKPLLFCFLSDEENTSMVRRFLEQYMDYPVFSEPGEVLPALEKSLFRYRRREVLRQRPLSSAEPIAPRSLELLLERELYLDEALRMAGEMGIPVVPFGTAEDPEGVVEVSARLGYPVVLKLNLPSSYHKTEEKAVVMDVGDDRSALRAFEGLISNAESRGLPHRGVVVQRQLSGGLEVILGAKVDDHFGPTVMVGMGGIYAEVLRDVSIRVAPISELDAEEMIKELKVYPILRGERTGRPFAIDGLKEALLRLSHFITSAEGIAGIDLNPVFLYPEGLWAVDARFIRKT